MSDRAHGGDDGGLHKMERFVKKEEERELRFDEKVLKEIKGDDSKAEGGEAWRDNSKAEGGEAW